VVQIASAPRFVVDCKVKPERGIMVYEIVLANSESIHTAVIRGRVPPQELAQFVPAACGEVWSFVRSAKLPRPGRHVALYLDEQGSVEVGVEVSEPFVGNDRVHCSKLPAGQVVTTIHFGPYSLLRDAHAAIRHWCAGREYQLSGVAWELYGHWHESWNVDSAKIRTDVVHLLRDGTG
jgi:effector-binding domain-containing protein